MAGTKNLRKLQLGQESTAGTAVAATAIWRGQGTLQDDLQVVHVEEDVGYLSGTDRTHISRLGAMLTMDSTPATFEQLPYVLSAGVEDVTTGGADGAGTGKIYQYDFPTTAVPSIQTYTIEGGDNQQAEEMEYSFVKRFQLTGQSSQAVMLTADWVGRQVSTASFTGALSLPTVEDILFNKSKLYIDAATGTIGSTLKSNTLLGFTLDYNTGLLEKYTGDGQLYFGWLQSVMPEATLSVTFEHDGTAVAEKAAWRAQTARAIRLTIEGSAVATPGTTYTYKTLNIDVAGKWESFDKIGEQNGNDIVTGTLRVRYNSDAALFGQIIVVNELTSLT